MLFTADFHFPIKWKYLNIIAPHKKTVGVPCFSALHFATAQMEAMLQFHGPLIVALGCPAGCIPILEWKNVN